MEQQPRVRRETEKAPATQQMTQEDFHPSVEWTSSPTTHVLRIHLPGFEKEDLKVVVDSSGKLTVRGKGKIPDTKHVRLEQSFDIPEDSDAEKITGRFEQEYLTVIMPRKPIHGESSWKNVPFHDKKGKGPICKEGGMEKMESSGKKMTTSGKEGSQEAARLDNLLEKISSNKKVIAVAVAAFAVGFYVSHKLKSRA